MWGEVGTKGEEDRANFLYAETAQPDELPKRQAKIKLLSGQQWLCNFLIKELVGNVVEMMELVAGTELWEEWDQPQPDEQVENRRTQKEEKWLWKMLDECDIRQAREAKRNIKNQKRKVEKARKRLKAGVDQPSIVDMFSTRQTISTPASKAEGSNCGSDPRGCVGGSMNVSKSVGSQNLEVSEECVPTSMNASKDVESTSMCVF